MFLPDADTYGENVTSMAHYVQPVFENPNDRERDIEPGLRSKIEVDTANNPRAGRSWTGQWVHLSEISFWSDPGVLVTGLVQGVDETNPETGIFLESTANGIVACDQDGILKYFNHASRKFHGLPSKPIPPDEWADHYDLYEADGKTPMTVERIPLFRALQGEEVKDQELMIVPKGRPARVLVR